MALTAFLYTDALTERRDSGRRSIQADSTLRDTSTQPHAITLNDLSHDGCLIDGGVGLAPGDVVSIGLSGVGRKAATVVRTQGERVGCHFDTPLSAADFARAFEVPTVVDGGFMLAALPRPLPEPTVTKWHPALRITLLLGLSSALWSAVLHIA